jgi:hypothetical protein
MGDKPRKKRTAVAREKKGVGQRRDWRETCLEAITERIDTFKRKGIRDEIEIELIDKMEEGRKQKK